MHFHPYGGMYNSPPQQKAFKFNYTFEPPSQLAIEVTHQAEKPVIYMRKNQHFMSLSMEEMYDISTNIKNMLDKMELCKRVVQGKTDFQPRSKKDLMMVAKRSARARQLEREEQMNMYWTPPVKAKKKQP